MNYTDIKSELINYLTPQHQKNINKDAFSDIAHILLDFHNHKNELYTTKWVCNASMGHGKTTVITSYLKWNKTEPILLCVKEKQLAHEIYTKVSKINPSIINLNADNKELYEMDLSKYQIVIIQHERLKNLTLNFGNIYNYQFYIHNGMRVKRKLIIDERPPFHDAVTYDITSHNNVLEWFDSLSQPFKYKPLTIQKYKSYVIYLVSCQLADNATDITDTLIHKDEWNSTKTKDLITFLNDMRDHPDNTDKYNSLNALRHFKKLLKTKGYGRIDDYTYNKTGRKIIVSKYIDYSKLKMNMVIFDGTATITHLPYQNHYELKEVKNRNNYTRLYLYNDQMNTSLYARSKDNKGVQKTIATRINQLNRVHNDLFLLPMKDDINIYHKEKAITEEQMQLYKDDKQSQTKGLNLLNTTGKNALNSITTLYLPCLPKRNAEHYKEIAISLYDNEVSLLTSENKDNGKWFQDERLEKVYQLELYAEILQIIHRTALRNIDSNEKINVYFAYYDVRESNSYEYVPLLEGINKMYMNNKANIPVAYKLYSMYDYGRDKKLDSFIEVINSMNIVDPVPISEVSQSFKRYIHNHYNNKKETIDNYFSNSGYKIIEMKDRFSDNSKYVKKK
ncbi:hypothetical protein QH639_19375 [Lysinibacillus sp. 1 U-2021]|uniref:hypothetical protein n=1 Tax=Lysinibacillus sp. 1 U-2021 TaxID=3039426 RepID=UPI002480F8A8|nr:hypothetical protein [Lysinibacillus sp. 1 U-2021]WGT37965.1 hypothetical protein QH639_19375 [Lysinibacillus sp. 1 U-2021]